MTCCENNVMRGDVNLCWTHNEPGTAWNNSHVKMAYLLYSLEQMKYNYGR